MNKEIIKEVLDNCNFTLEDETVEKLVIYQNLLIEKNKLLDLTNVEEKDMPLRHFADSIQPLYVFPHLFKENMHIIDVGTGAGMPGLPMAIVRKDISFCLLDTQKKRCEFLSEVVKEADLKNVTVIHSRAEDYAKKEGRELFDVALARAVASLPVLLEYLLPYVKVTGTALMLKGPNVYDEIEQAKIASQILGGGKVNVAPVPLKDMHHTIVTVEKMQKTLLQYPRKSGTPSKKPLGI